MVTSCPQNNVLSTEMLSSYHPSTPHRTGYRESAQTVAPRTPRIPRMIKTPIPRLRSSALRVSTPRDAFREDLDRFIPSRRRMNMDLCRLKLNSASNRRESSSDACCGPASVARAKKLVYEKQLLSTLCNVSTSSSRADELQSKSFFQYGNVSPLKSGNRRAVIAADPLAMDFLRARSSSPIQKPIAVKRAISGRPVTILDCPSLVDDYYTHPLSWNKNNVLAVALGTSVYVMNDFTRAVHEIKGAGITPRDRTGAGSSNHVRSVNWCTMDGLTHLLAVGTSADSVRVYDTNTNQLVVDTYLLPDPEASPVRALCWNDSRQWLTAGDVSGTVANLDLRSGLLIGMARPRSAPSSVCNLAWNAGGTCLASGRNDNTIHLWDASMMCSAETGGGPRLVLEAHAAAVKGLAWCPHRSDVLASGGGSADGCIKLWNACSGSLLNSVSTGSQVSSLVWGRHHEELYSSHGYSDTDSTLMNTVVAWSYAKMERIETLRSHKARILSMGMSPDGTKLASISADETLCVWKIASAPPRSRFGAGDVFGSPSFGSRFAIR